MRFQGPIKFNSTLRLLVLDSEIDPDANKAILDQPVRQGRRHVRPEIPKRIRGSETDQTPPAETHQEPRISSSRSFHAEKRQVRDEPHPYAQRRIVLGNRRSLASRPNNPHPRPLNMGAYRSL